MSNLYKGQGTIGGTSATRVIDSNDLLHERIELFRIKEQRSGKQSEEPSEDEPVETEDGFTDGIGEVVEEPQIDYVALAQEEADILLSNAREEAERIVNEAQGQAEAMKSHAFEEGRKEGFDSGRADASVELERGRQQLEEEGRKQQKQFEMKQSTMERDLVDVISDVFEKVFAIQFADKREILIHLVENAVTNIEGSKEFQVKVNDENYQFLQDNKAVIQERVGEDAKIDIISDPLMDKNQCMIETDGGVFDCSLGVQLENLIKDLKSLSL